MPGTFNGWMEVTPYYANNLYTNFHFIDEPWNTTYKRKSIEVIIQADCDLIALATTKKGVVTPYGIMQVTNIEIKYKDKTMKLTGKI
jgi:hypothetical protein